MMPKLQINGASLHVHSSGSGIPIVFVHPPLLTRSVFTYQSEQLADAFRIIAFDIRGHGQSEYSPQPLSYSLIAEDMKQLLDALDIEKAFVCGYSTGGSVALEAMLTYPDRFVGGILVSAMSELSDFYNTARVGIAVALTQIKATRLLALGICYGNADGSPTFRHLLDSSGRGKGNPNIEQYFRLSLAYNCTSRLREIHQPVLLLYGEKDNAFRRYGNLLRERLPNSSIHYLSDVAHQIPTKAAARMNGAIHCWIRDRLKLTTLDDERLPQLQIPYSELSPIAHPETDLGL